LEGLPYRHQKPFDTTHKFIWWIERQPGKVLDQLQISDSTLGEAAKRLCTAGYLPQRVCGLDATRRVSAHLPQLYSLDCLAESFSEVRVMQPALRLQALFGVVQVAIGVLMVVAIGELVWGSF
jgi:hypothetical protein